MKDFCYRIFCGFFLGISIFAPGVSGSVMAIMMGIYPRLLGIVSNPFKNLKKNIAYLFPMGIGALISFIFFILVFGYLFETYEKATYLLFIGLMAGNLPVVFKDANQDGFKKRYLFGIIGAFLVTAWVGISVIGAEDRAISTGYLALSGTVTGAASMVPGMSISMLLMLFGVYEYLMGGAHTMMSAFRETLSFASFDFAMLLNFAVFGGVFVAGMVAFSNFTKFIFKRYHNFAYFMVFGFMCGCLVGICYRLQFLDNTGFNWLIGALMLALGLSISFLFVYLGKKFNVDEK